MRRPGNNFLVGVRDCGRRHRASHRRDAAAADADSGGPAPPQLAAASRATQYAYADYRDTVLALKRRVDPLDGRQWRRVERAFEQHLSSAAVVAMLEHAALVSLARHDGSDAPTANADAPTADADDRDDEGGDDGWPAADGDKYHALDALTFEGEWA